MNYLAASKSSCAQSPGVRSVSTWVCRKPFRPFCSAWLPLEQGFKSEHVVNLQTAGMKLKPATPFAILCHRAWAAAGLSI